MAEQIKDSFIPIAKQNILQDSFTPIESQSFGVNPNPNDEETLGLWERTKKLYQRGDAGLVRSSYGAAALRGEISVQEAQEKGNKEYLQDLERIGKIKEVAFTEHPVRYTLGAIAETAPFLIGAAQAGVESGLTFGIGASIATWGLDPTDIITAPVAGALGSRYGVFKYSLDMEGGGLFLDLLDGDIPENIARPIATAAGGIMATIEVAQFGGARLIAKLGPAGLKKALAKKLMSKPAQKVILEGMKKYVKAAGGEWSEEIYQYATEIVATIIAGKIADKPDVIPTNEEIVKGAIETAKKSASVMALLPAPGVAIETSIQLKQVQAMKEMRDQTLKNMRDQAVKEEVERTVKETPFEPGKEKIVKEKIVEKKEREVGKEPTTEEIAESLFGKEEPLAPEAKEEALVDVKKTQIKGRLNKLDADIKSNRKQQDELARRKKEIKKQGRSTKAIDKKIDKLIQKEEVIDSERAELLIEEEGAIKLSREKVELRADEISRKVDEGIRKGEIRTRKDIKSKQKEIKDMIRKSDLSGNDKSKFITSITNVTPKNFAKQLSKVRDKISELREASKKRKLKNDLKDMTKKKALKGLRPEYKKKVESLVTGISITKPTKKKVRGLLKLKESLQSEEFRESNIIPDSRLNELSKLEQTPVSELSLEDLEAITFAVKHLIKLNNLKNKLLINKKQKDFNKTKKKSISNLEKGKAEDFEGSVDNFDATMKTQEPGILKKVATVESFNPETLTEILDGEDYGTIKEVIYLNIMRGVSDTLSFQHKAEDFVRNKIRDIKVKNWSDSFKKKAKDVKRKQFTLESGKKVSLTPAERIALYLHSLNKKNKKHLLEGGFAFSSKKETILSLTQQDLDNITQLSKEELKVANTLYEYLNIVQKEKINEVSVRLLGAELAIEEHYFPIRTNYLDRVRDNLIKAKKYSQLSLEGLGALKERKNAKDALILDDAFVATYKSIYQISEYVGLAEPLRSAKALLENNEFQIKAAEVGFKSQVEALKTYIRRLEGESIRLDNVDKLTTDLINKLDVAILGPNVFVWLKQPVSYLLASTEIDGKYLKTSFKMNPTKAEISEMRKYSPFIRDRLDGNVTREAGEVAQVGKVLKFFTDETVGSQKMMWGIRKFDLASIGSIWRAVKKEVSDKTNLEGDAYFERVAERTWEIVRRTQPTFHVIDRSNIGSSPNMFIRLLTKYTSQLNKNYNMNKRAFMKYNRSHKTPSDKAILAKSLTMINIVTALMIAGINEVRRRVYDLGKEMTRDEEKEYNKATFKRFISNYISAVFGQVYVLGPAVYSLMSKIDRGTWAGYDINTTVIGLMDEIVNLTTNILHTIGYAITQEEYKDGRLDGEKRWKESLKRALIRSGDTIGKLKGIGVSPIRRTLTGPIRWLYKKIQEYL